MHLNRYQASLTHLIISAAVVGCFFSIVFFIWYPNPYFSIEDTLNIMVILFTVDVVLGPLLTLVIFKSGKPGLKSDLSIIAAIQIIALVYGASIIYSERPYFIAFDYKKFFVVRASDAKYMDLSTVDAKINHRQAGPTYVYADVPNHLSPQGKILFKAFLRPERYRELKNHLDNDFEQSLDLNILAEHSSENKTLIDDFRARHPDVAMNTLAFYPLQGKIRFIILVFTRNTAEIIDYILINSEEVPNNTYFNQKNLSERKDDNQRQKKTPVK
ncbi:MAG: hypothetical protein KAT25_00720 [Sulfuriflexus sp.]|nr:hypothetical protein [Sulfuriflexus sp.]